MPIAKIVRAANAYFFSGIPPYFDTLYCWRAGGHHTPHNMEFGYVLPDEPSEMQLIYLHNVAFPINVGG